jgi:hypothetical protein
MNAQDAADLIGNIREEVIGLLFNRYVFRTHQEIVRLNPRLQGRPRGVFSEWAQLVYAQAAAVGVRRLAGQDPEEGDVNLVGLLELLIRDPSGLWECFLQHFPEDAAKARGILEREGPLPIGWEVSACKRLLGEDRRALISIAQRAVQFASKRVAHSVPDVPVKTTFDDLDQAIDMVKGLTEKYTRLLFTKRLRELEPLHRAGKDNGLYGYVLQLSERIDLVDEMKRRQLQDGWKEIFLEPWATREDIDRELGDTPPPRRVASGL